MLTSWFGGRNAEGGFGLICSCIPALHILVSRVKAKMRKGSRSRSTTTGKGSSAIASGDGSGSGSGGGKKRDRGVSSSGGTAAPIVITSSPEDVLHDPGGLLASCDDGDGDDDVYDQNEEGEGRGEKNDRKDDREGGWV